MNLREMKTFAMMQTINDMLSELNARGVDILDYENKDYALDRLEYHKAEDIHGEKFGDGTDNIYCRFKEAK